jgi:hypothetical protein
MLPRYRLPTILLAALATLAIPGGAPAAAGRIGPPVGSYNLTTVDEESRLAASFAVREQGRRESRTLKLLAITRAEKQVVAGLNFRVTLTVQSGGRNREARAVVFRSLDRYHELVSWDWLPPPATPKP